MLGGHDGDMFMMIDSSGDIWYQGEGGARMAPEGGNIDKKNSWYNPSSFSAGDFSTTNMVGHQTSTGSNIAFLVRTDGSITMTGSDASALTGSASPSGTASTGNPPHQAFTHAGSNVHQAVGNPNRMVVTFRS